MHRVDGEQSKTEQNYEPRRKRSFRLSVSDAGLFAFTYAVTFIAFRFDVRRHGPSFQHPMTTGTSAWVALLFATVIRAYWKIRRRGQ
jgi:hypothetical protein